MHLAPLPSLAKQPSADHLLHRLHQLQEHHRYIPAETLAPLAAELGLPISQIEAVIDFYNFFHRTPRGCFDILFSNCTSCGDLALMQQLCELLDVQPGVTRADGKVSIDQTSCVGMCDQGAAALVNGRTLTKLTTEQLPQLTALVNTATPLDAWPVGWFSVQDNIRHAGLLINDALPAGAGLRAVLQTDADQLLAEIKQSGLRGRGGAGFNTALKWQLCRAADAPEHYVVCNADEGEPGTFKDRVLLTSFAQQVFEGMALCAYVINARHGFLYLRGEYRYLLPSLEATLAEMHATNLLGENILKQPGFDFDISIVLGAGAYICGEESSLLESLEQKRGVARVRPPFPVTHGYRGQSTVVDNVETLLAATHIAVHGGQWFRDHGTAQSAGTKILSVSGDCTAPGIYEFPFGISLQTLLETCGGLDAQAVQVGGPSGTLVSREEFGRKLAFEDLATGGSIMVYGAQRDLLAVVRNFTHFFAHESCGFCTPCRVGTPLLRKYIDKIAAGHGTAYDREEMVRLGKLVKRRSHCGLGQTAANPLLDLLEKFPQVCSERLLHQDYEPFFNLDAALATTRDLTHRDDAEAHLS
ncbi:NADH-ubiquinone oxidoreductase-F iron-sulfur binding region domain-containing protein [uncultured Thiothrix sp.]|uniref:NADH-ubiquinone oxidoreductase-F iron-sulfur binding region domain-containing protein n=1 Tax=uncultured Thiothrix sp. TaxID=223185 RepID=UPI002630EAAB|nr:NADH-ubiquinone oxidoreductase-F iron-sulfur binding region domain-containing protein [uncultured Thiothrix sp.]HMT92717.1 NADH-ubiquinone oxidoreductase-F iron-sulfur binding region domain-containing protein [Thiolinea sp.]